MVIRQSELTLLAHFNCRCLQLYPVCWSTGVAPAIKVIHNTAFIACWLPIDHGAICFDNIPCGPLLQRLLVLLFLVLLSLFLLLLLRLMLLLSQCEEN